MNYTNTLITSLLTNVINICINGYSRKLLKYLEIIVLYNPPHISGMVVDVETSRIDNRCSFEEFIELMCMNP